MPRSAVVLDGRLLEADPAREPAQEAVTLRHPEHGIHDGPRHVPEVRAAVWKVQRREPVQQPVEEPRGGDLEPPLHVLRAPNRGHDVVALAGLFQEQRDHLGRVLQVAVHRDHGFAPGGPQPGGQSDLVPEVPRQAKAPVAWVRAGLLLHDLPGAVRGAVVHANHLGVGVEIGKHRVEAREQLRQDRGFVVAGQNDGEIHCVTYSFPAERPKAACTPPPCRVTCRGASGSAQTAAGRGPADSSVIRRRAAGWATGCFTKRRHP